MTREMLLERGRRLEAAWCQMVEYQEFTEDFVKRFGRTELDEMIKVGNIRPAYFWANRAHFESCWYGRAPWMSPTDKEVLGG